MSKKNIEHTIELKYGFTDDKGVTHKTVTFGRRITGAELIDLDADPQSSSRTQHGDLIRRKAMTKFGSLKTMPPTLPALLSLNKIDRGDIAKAYDDFQIKGREGLETSFDAKTGLLTMYFGFEIEGVTYRIAELKRLTTGYDEVAADTLNLDGLAREMFMLGRTISKLINEEDPTITFEGPIGLEPFRSLDGDDIVALRQGALLAELSFRYGGEEVSKKSNRSQRNSDSEANRLVGSGDPKPSKTPAE
jgi:hypothetical protein